MCHRSTNFLMLRELKAVDFLLNTTLDCIWKDATKIYTNHPIGKGGATLLINPCWARYIQNIGISPCNHVAWAIFDFNHVAWAIFDFK